MPSESILSQRIIFSAYKGALLERVTSTGSQHLEITLTLSPGIAVQVKSIKLDPTLTLNQDH